MRDVKWFDHQSKILNDTRFFPNVGLFCDMGLGKSLLSCAIMERYQTEYNLCICQKSKVKDFVDMFKEQGFHTIDYAKNPIIEPGIIVINYELTWRRPELASLENFTMILDESSKIMHEKSKQTKFIVNKLKAKHVILCSGSPCNGKYENLYTQCRLLGYNVTQSMYWDQYVVWELAERMTGTKSVHYKKVLGYKNTDMLKDVLRTHGAIFLKSEDCIKLPDSIDTTVKVPSFSAYKKFAKDRVAIIENTEFVGNCLLTLRLRLRQLCGSYNSEKLTAFADLLDSCEDRLIVFYNFQRDYYILRDICERHERPISSVNGSDKDLSNYDKYENSVTLIQFQSGSFGLNLQKSNKIVFFSPPESSDTYIQARARIRRIGQSRTCYYWHLVQEHSIEELIYNAINNGIDYTNYLFVKDYPQYDILPEVE